MNIKDVEKLTNLKYEYDKALSDYQKSFRMYSVDINFDLSSMKSFGKSSFEFGALRKAYIDHCFGTLDGYLKQLAAAGVDISQEYKDAQFMLVNDGVTEIAK